MNYHGFATEVYVLVFAGIGLILLAVTRIAGWERSERRFALAMVRCGRAVTALAIGAGLLLAIGHLVNESVHWPIVKLLAAQAIVSLIAAGLVTTQSWRRIFTLGSTLALGEGVICIAVQGHLTPSQRLEVLLVIAGLFLLVIGHVNWYREQNRRSHTATFGLLCGSLLAGVLC